MATQKGNKQGKSDGGMGWGSNVRNRVDVGSDNTNKNESDVSLVVVLCIAIMALTFVLVLPLLGLMYMDMNNATGAAVQEIKKMRELRAQMLMMMRGE